MDSPSYSDYFKNLQPQCVHKIKMKAVFNEKLLEVNSELTKNAKISLYYTLDNYDGEFELSMISPVTILKRNALTWDDTKKLASFITPFDPVVKSFARRIVNVAKEIWSNEEYYLPTRNLKIANAVWSTLTTLGLTYVSDPKGIKSSFGSEDSIDYVQYARELLESKSGDCDDFVVLFCSVIENLGIETILVTVPGHIFLMFDTGIKPSELKTYVTDDQMVIVNTQDNKVWLPLELTYIAERKSFVEAWKKAIVTYQNNRDKIEMVYTNQAQIIFTPISFKTVTSYQNNIDISNVHKSYKSNARKYISFSTDNIGKNYLFNGIMFARYHKWRKAEKYFRREKNKKLAYTNMGNMYIEKGDYKRAKKFFRKALRLDKDFSPARYGLVMIYERVGEVKKFNRELLKLPSALRNQFFKRSKIEKDSIQRATGNEQSIYQLEGSERKNKNKKRRKKKKK